ncbi:MAG: cobalamin-dependent protein [Coriobacteriales bacterium]|jgi:methylmalonyl-CoA mutase cobalamin-binding domain/chain|nr:cobalamin-dependent protein [Coriobacteriales bacterium]
MNQELINAMADIEDEVVFDSVNQSLADGIPAVDILADLQEGIRIVGERFANNQYFLPHLMLSGKLFKDVQDLMGDALSASDLESEGVFVLGTVKNDVHDIGKNIVSSVMGSNGFKVVDLGVDVAPEKFVEAIRETDAKVIGMSCLLTTTFQGIKDTVDAIEAADLRKGRLLMIGGGPVDENTLKFSGADVVAKTAQDGVRIAKEFLATSTEARY